MGGVAKAVTGAVEGVVGAVGDAVEDVGHAVESVGKTVEKAVDGVVASAKGDPAAFIASMAAVATGQLYLLPMISATSTLAHGGTIGQALESAAISTAAAAVGAQVTPGFSEAALNTAARGAAAGATSAALRGGDIATGAVAGGLNAGINSGLNSAINTDAYDVARADAEARYNEPGPTEQDVLARDPSIPIPELVANTNEQYAGQKGFYDEETGKFVPSDIGGLNSPLDSTTGSNYERMGGYNADTDTWDASDQDLNSDSGSRKPYEPLPLDTVESLKTTDYRLPSMNWAGAMGVGSQPSGQGQGALGNVSAKTTPTGQMAGQNLLDANALDANSTGDQYELQRLKQLYGSLTPEMQTILKTNNGQNTPITGQQIAADQQPMFMASGGSTDPWADLVNSAYKSAATSNQGATFVGGGQRRIAQLAPLVQMQKGITRMAHGGLPARHHPEAPEGHHPEFVTGETGYYAQGRGTGQSDDIPAMLRHGDYVVDADTVAALGDGSSKAGAEVLEDIRRKVPAHHAEGGSAAGSSIPAQIADGEYVFPAAFVTAIGSGDNARGAKILDGMRQKIREHKRSAPSSKIPPKAKSPLAYIKMASKG